MFSKILVLYDGSIEARRALDVAVDLAKKYGAELWAVGSEDLPHYAKVIPEEMVEQDYQKSSLDEILVEVAASAEREGVELTTKTLTGRAENTVVQFATEHSFDLIVVSHAAHSAL